ncbi:hypothetical protein [Micromonospora sp. MA102]|uniref:hypothetical protein n=1 Tax=Micromonospora sp. MA102 TaxID=2952755 RepID=UPI0021C5B5F4|nr:hypothetical protein [Micromonospora sp. MA102]
MGTTVAVVSAIAAVLAALFAGSQAIAARQQARHSEAQLELAERVRKDQAQPYVYADIRPDEHDPQKIMFVVQNLGATVARHVRVSFDPPLTSVARPAFGEEVEVLHRPISALPPGRKLQWFFDLGFRIFQEPETPKRYTATITADGPFGAVDELTYVIDLNELRQADAAPPVPKRIADELQKARGALEKVASYQSQIAANSQHERAQAVPAQSRARPRPWPAARPRHRSAGR